MNIYKKIHEIQKKVSGLRKDSRGNGYEYVSGTKVLSFIKPIMDEQGLILKQEILSIENVRQDYETASGKKKNEILSKVMMRFTFVCIETGEKDENLFGANGQNGWDKGVGSALTYGERYFLLKYFHIATDEDDIDQPAPEPAPKPDLPIDSKSWNQAVEKKAPLDKLLEHFTISEANQILYSQLITQE